MAINPDKLNEFLGKALVDFGATFNAALIRIGDKLGLYKALATGGPQTSAELAAKTGTTERYIREWLSAQAAGGYVTAWLSASKILPSVLVLGIAVLVLSGLSALQQRGEQPITYLLASVAIAPLGVLAGGLVWLRVEDIL